MALARLYRPSGGKLLYGDRDAAPLPEAVIGARIGYVAQNAYLFSASVRDNLTYALRQRVVAPPEERDPKLKAARHRFLAETKRAGNLELDIQWDWIDLATAGIKDKAELTSRIVDVLKAVDMEEDVFQLGLRGTIDPKRNPDAAKRVLEARQGLLKRLSDPHGEADLKTLIEPFSPDAYNTNATVAENLLFGTPIDPAFEVDRLAENTALLAVLAPARWPKRWSSSSPICRPVTSSSNSSASSPPTICRKSRRCFSASTGREPKSPRRTVPG